MRELTPSEESLLRSEVRQRRQVRAGLLLLVFLAIGWGWSLVNRELAAGASGYLFAMMILDAALVSLAQARLAHIASLRRLSGGDATH